MKFWDSSAIAPLLVAEAATQRLQAVVADDPAMLVWWGTEVECASALTRREREGSLSSQSAAVAWRRLGHLIDAWDEVDPSDSLQETAARFLRVHPLRSADALQLAAAFLAAERLPASLDIVTLDERLAVAARKEGFPLLDLGTGV